MTVRADDYLPSERTADKVVSAVTPPFYKMLHRTMSCAMCFSLIGFLSGFAADSGKESSAWRYKWPALVPGVMAYTYDSNSRVALDEHLAVEVSGVREGEATDRWVAEKMVTWFGKRPHVHHVEHNTNAQAGIPSGDEAYAISAKADTLRISANTLQGVKWAMMTLRQLAQPIRGTFKLQGYEIPALSIRDRPEVKFRAMHLCAFPEVSPARIERGIRMAAYYKFNHVILESWGVFRSERHPWYGWKDGWLTPAECRRLADMARDLGVTLIPFFNVFGHAGAARGRAFKHAVLDVSPEYQPLFEPRSGFTWCLANPEARRVIGDMVEELHAAFGRPPYFHLGCDEADPPSCAACCGGDYAKLVARHINTLAAHVVSLGARPMVWHDLMLKKGDPRWKGMDANGTDATVALLDTLSKDVIICDWYYYDPPKDGIFPSLEHFKNMGFETMTCPWDNVNGIVAQCAYARRDGLGVICTTWHHFVASSIQFTYAYAASCAWSAEGEATVKSIDAEYKMLHDTVDTHWRQVGWDTPGCDRYPETGIFPDQIGASIGER